MSFYQNLFSRNMSFYQNLCSKKGLSFHINKEKAARISCENILAALYGSLKNFISCRKHEQGSRWYSGDHGSPCAQ